MGLETQETGFLLYTALTKARLQGKLFWGGNAPDALIPEGSFFYSKLVCMSLCFPFVQT